MLRNALKYGTGLIALYLVVVNASGFGSVISRGAQGVSQISKTLQGR